jgi:hypothetical protein
MPDKTPAYFRFRCAACLQDLEKGAAYFWSISGVWQLCCLLDHSILYIDSRASSSGSFRQYQMIAATVILARRPLAHQFDLAIGPGRPRYRSKSATEFRQSLVHVRAYQTRVLSDLS